MADTTLSVYLVVAIQISLVEYSNRVSTGLQKPEIVGLGKIACLKSKKRRPTTTGHNPEVVSSNRAPTSQTPPIVAIGGVCRAAGVVPNSPQVFGTIVVRLLRCCNWKGVGP